MQVGRPWPARAAQDPGEARADDPGVLGGYLERRPVEATARRACGPNPAKPEKTKPTERAQKRKRGPPGR